MIKKSIIIFSLLIFLAISIIGSWLYFVKLVDTKNQSDKKEDIIEINAGTSSLGVAKKLQDFGAIKDYRIFLIYTKLYKKNIQAGTHTLVYNISTRELADKLSSGEYLLKKITIPEGKRIEQVAAIMEDRNLFNYNDMISASLGKEGKLFPDTYYISKNSTADQFIKMMTDNYSLKTSSLNLSPDELILASIIEREAIIDSERPIIAGIFNNRLKIGMRLEADPTVLYANDTQKIIGISPYDATQYTFWQPISFSLYRSVISPYNTYINSGLPPAPICSPGLASISAAQNPDNNNYYFFLHGSDGGFYPAVDNSGHEDNKKRYLK